jgi:lipoprotein-releasing system ATP-binding protein
MRRITGDCGASYLLVTHNLDPARRCDRIIQIVDGRMQP